MLAFSSFYYVGAHQESQHLCTVSESYVGCDVHYVHHHCLLAVATEPIRVHTSSGREFLLTCMCCLLLSDQVLKQEHWLAATF